MKELFKNCHTKEEAKGRYNELSKIYHPDVGKEPDGQIFIEITNAYKEHLHLLKYPAKKKKSEPKPKPKAEPLVEELEEYEIKKPRRRLNKKQKKNLSRGGGIILSVLIDRYL